MKTGTRFQLPAIAATAVILLSPATTVAQDLVQAGVSAAVRGQIEVASLTDTVGRVIGSGENIFLGDRVSSGANSGLQVLLLDETVFTIGSDSAIVIDKFVYDPAAGAGKVAARIVKGAFRFVTGRIARNKPQDMTVKLPTGSMAIRGTMVAGKVEGDTSLVVLLGPGEGTNTTARIGRVEVSSAGTTVELTRPGFATTIDGIGAVPTEPFQLPASDIQALSGSLTARPSSSTEKASASSGPTQSGNTNSESTPSAEKSQPQASGTQSSGGSPSSDSTEKSTAESGATESGATESGATESGATESGSTASAGDTTSTASAGDLAGQTTAGGADMAGSAISIGEVRDANDVLAVHSTQSDPDGIDADTTTVADSVTTLEELRKIESGSHTYIVDTEFVQTAMDGKSVNIAGTMLVKVEIDFGARTIGGDNSGITLETLSGGGNIDFFDPVLSESYADGPDSELTDHTYGQSPMDPDAIKGSVIEIRNKDGVIAQEGRADIVYDDGSNKGKGAGTSPPRTN
ncbi:MAG: FecR domain-containing protein [Rhodospirillaceae bacterium]|nr:FecR domain-containing protein [Rhodospirillaceae bacterium]